MKGPDVKRVSFSESDAAHLYEALRGYWWDDAQRFGGCPQCDQIGRRLERIIGRSVIRYTERVLKAHPPNAKRDR